MNFRDDTCSYSNKDIPNEDFDCNPNGDCWCKKEKFPPLPHQSDICYSPREIAKIKYKDIQIDGC